MTKLREVRERTRLTGSMLADAMGVNKSYVANIERGLVKPSPRFVRDASIVLGLALGVDAALVRREAFPEDLKPSLEAPPSFLERRVLGGVA